MRIKVVDTYNPETEDEIYYIEMSKDTYNRWADGGQIYFNRWTDNCDINEDYFVDADHWFVTREGLETINGIEYFEDDDAFYDEHEDAVYYSLKFIEEADDFGILTIRDFGNTVGLICTTF